MRIIAEPGGSITSPFDVDLSDPADGAGRWVVRCLDPAGMNVEIADFL